MISVLLSAIAFFLIWCICKWVVRKLDKDYAVVELVALMYSNCGFIGIPMAQGIFGAEGVFYMTAYVDNSTIFYVVLLEERGKKRWN